MRNDTFQTEAEFKFADDSQPGEFDGYGAVFGNVDSHDDRILPGAFAESLAAHKSAGTMPGMFVEHSAFKAGDPLPVGQWISVEEDTHGLRVKGRLLALDTDHGRRVHALMKAKALRGLSIAFHVPAGGAIYGKAAGEPRRQLKALQLHAVDIVRDPSNALAGVRGLKSTLALTDVDMARTAVAGTIGLLRMTMTGSDAPTAAERAAMLQQMQAAHVALTGEELAEDTKESPTTIRQFEELLRQAPFNFSNSKARAIAEHGFKTATTPRDEGGAAATKAVLSEMRSGLAGFSLPSFS